MDEKDLQNFVNEKISKISKIFKREKVEIFKYNIHYIDFIRSNPFMKTFENYDGDEKDNLSFQDAEIFDLDYEANQFIDLYYRKIGLDINSVAVIFDHEKEFKKFRKMLLKELKVLKENFNCKIQLKNREVFLQTKIILRKEKELLKSEDRFYLFKYNYN